MRARFGGNWRANTQPLFPVWESPCRSLSILATSCPVAFFSNISFCSKEHCFCRGPCSQFSLMSPPSPTRADERYNRSVGYVVLPAAPAVRLDHSRFDNAQTPRTRSINQKTCAMRPGGPAVPPPPAPDHHSSADPYSARGCAVLGNQRISLQLSHSVIVLQCAKRTRHG